MFITKSTFPGGYSFAGPVLRSLYHCWIDGASPNAGEQDGGESEDSLHRNFRSPWCSSRIVGSQRRRTGQAEIGIRCPTVQIPVCLPSHSNRTVTER